MGKTLRIYIVFFVLLVVVLFIFEINKPKQIDWSPSFNKEHKKPFGTYILYHELKTILGNDKIISDLNITPFEFIRNNNSYIDSSCYLFLNNYLNIDEKSEELILDHVACGNTAFLISNYIPENISEALNISVEYEYLSNSYYEKQLYLVNKAFKDKKYYYNKGIKTYYFSKLDSSLTTVLGYQKIEDAKYINFVKIDFGDGQFYINLQPFAFTNYHMLKENHAEYISSVLSYVDKKKVYWDRKLKADQITVRNPLRFILSNEALGWAWRLSLLGLIIFVIFTAKRRQRIIPIINKLSNTSLDFVKTIGSLYYQKGNPKDIVNLKINFLLEYIRQTYMLDTQNLNEDFKKRLHYKTGIEKDEIDRFVNFIIILNKSKEIKENSLIILNKMLEQFYKKTKI